MGRRVNLLEALLLGATILYLALFLAHQTVGLSSPAVLEYDSRTNFMAALRYHGSGLFAHDLMADMAGRNGALGWDALLWIWTLFADPIWFSKLMPFALFAVTAVYAFRLGRVLGGVGLGCAFCLVLAHTGSFWMTMAGGLPRSFGFACVFAWLFYAATDRHRAALAAVFAASLLYPPTFLVLAAAHALWVVRRRDLWLASALAIVAGGLLYLPKAIANGREFGANPSYAEALARPDLGPTGCTQAWPLPPLLDTPLAQAAKPYRTWGTGWLATPPWAAAILLAVLFAIALWRRQLALPPAVPLLLAGGLLIYLAARVLAFRLYLADRYTQFSVEPVAALALPLLLAAAAPRWKGLCAAAGTAAVLFIAYGNGLVRGLNLMDERQLAPDVLHVLAELPRETTIAAPLRLADAIPLATHRRVYLKEGAVATLPGGDKWFRELDRRLRAQFSAYYAADLTAAADFGQREHVDVLVVDTRDLGPRAPERARFWEPWGSWLGALVRDTPRFALADPPASAILYRRDPWLVVDLRRLGATAR